MLNTFRTISYGIGAKILLALLFLSFALWGMGDMLGHPDRNTPVAKVGDTAISREHLARALSRETEYVRRMMGENYTPEMLKKLRLPQYVLQKLINQRLLELETTAHGIIPSDVDVVRSIRTNPNYQDSKGNFDRSIFDAMLRNINMAEKDYVNQLRDEMAVNLLVDSISTVSPVPDVAAKTLLRAREESRRVTFYTLNDSLVSANAKPSDDEIKMYYDAHAGEFTAPEYRNLSYTTISNAEAQQKARVSDEDIKAAYEERIEEFRKPERRTVSQLLYSSEEQAQKAKEMLKGGKSFDQVAKETHILNKNSVAMGTVERNGVIESAADAVFSVKEGETTDPVQSPFGWHVFLVSAIEKPSVASLEQVRPMLEKDLKQRTEDEALIKMANQLEDALAGGSTLQEAAAEMKLKVSSLGPVNRQGLLPDGSKAKDIPALDNFIDVAFKTDEKAESPITTSKGGYFYILRVDSVVPERLRTLDEVRGLVVSNWQKEQRGQRLAELAQEVGQKFVKPAERAAIIGKYNLQPASSAVIKRGTHATKELSLPPPLVNNVFSVKTQEGTSAYPGGNGDYLLAVVDAVIPAQISDDDPKMAGALADIKRSLQISMQNEVLQEYTQYLQGKYPVTINESVLQSVFN